MPKLLTLKFKGIDFLGTNKEVLNNNIINELGNKGIYLNDQEKNDLKDLIDAKSKVYDTGGWKPYVQQKPMAKRLSFNDVINGAKAFLKFAGGVSVEQGEINRRAGICSAGANGGSCPKLSDVSNCKTCGGGGFTKNLVKWTSKLKEFFGGRKDFQIPNGLDSRYCGVCECSLALMLPSKTQAFDLQKEDDQKQRPNFCWIKQGGRNFIPSEE